MPSAKKSFRYLLDPNRLSDLVRHPAGSASSRIAQVGADEVCINLREFSRVSGLKIENWLR